MATTEFKIITINDKEKEGYVSLDALVKFSGNKYESTRDLVTKHKEVVERLGGKFKLRNNGQTDFKSVTFNEQQSAYIITLMSNTPEVLLFKETLIKEFYKYKLHLKQVTIELEDLKQKQQSIIDSKSDTINKLSNTVKEYKKIIVDDKIYISASGLVKGEDFTAKAFREFMLDLGLIEQYPSLQHYWKTTTKGLDSGMIIEDSQKTPYFSLISKELYKEHLEVISNGH